MRRHNLSLSVCLTILLTAPIGCRSRVPADDGTTDAAAVTKETEDWRAKHETDYRRDWVTIAGLHFLEPGRHTAGSATTNDIVLPASVPPVIGRFAVADRSIRFEPARDAGVTLDGKGVTEPMAIDDDGEPEPDVLTVGDVKMVVHRSGDRKALRVWDPQGPLARGFAGFAWFPIQPDYRVIAKFIPDAKSRDVDVLNTFGDIDIFKTEGVVEFVLAGQTVRLRPFTTRPKRFYFVFKDASSGAETYEAARFLYSDLRDDGTIVLDFNQAYNPPCAFNPYTTCPIPLPENRLPLKVLAGERAYAGPHPKLP